MNSNVILSQDRDGQFFLSLVIPIDHPKDFDPDFEETEQEVFAEAKARMLEAFSGEKKRDIEFQAKQMEEADQAVFDAQEAADLAIGKWRDALQEKRNPNLIHELDQVKRVAKKKVVALEKYADRIRKDYDRLRELVFGELEKIAQRQMKSLPFVSQDSQKALQAVSALVNKQAGPLVEYCKRVAVANKFVPPLGILNFGKVASEITEELFSEAEEAAQGQGALAS